MNTLIYDTTLRDGAQGPGINYTLQDKLDIAHRLDEMKIDYIEGGFPLSSEKEALFFQRAAKENFHHAKITAFGSTRRPGGSAAKDAHIQALLDAETPAVIVVGKSWLAHVEKVIRTTAEENLEMIYDSLSYLKSEGREVHFDLEHFFDGYKDNPEYALKVMKTATEAGAASLVLCDTNGGTLPHEVTRCLQSMPLNELAPLGVHFHNDTGCAVANSLAAVDAGALQVQGTINGWGERCGNANLCTIIPNLILKMEKSCACGDQLSDLTNLARFVAEKANIIPDERQPYVGDAAFSHKAGQHADVIEKEAVLMEHIDSSLVGNHRHILLSELAGKSTVVRKMKPYGDYSKKSEEVVKIFKTLKEKEEFGYEYEAAEASFDMVIRKSLGRYTPLFFLNNYHLESYKTGDTPAKTVGRLFLTNDGKQHMGAAVGIGPVETLDQALRDAILPSCPRLSEMKLVDFKVRVINPEEAAASRVRVFITSSNGKESWDTVGVSENIVEASWEALIDSMEYFYNNFVKDPV